MQVASSSTTRLVHNRAHQVSDGLQDGKAFAKQSRVDAFRDTPPDQLLTGLRGKNVLFTFIESYGRSAVEDPAHGTAGQRGARRTDRAAWTTAGFSSRSGCLTSPMTGAGSWLAHSTFIVGPVDQQPAALPHPHLKRPLHPHRRLPAHRAPGGRSASCRASRSPGRRGSSTASTTSTTPRSWATRDRSSAGPPCPTSSAWPPSNAWSTARRSHKPLMAEIILASSHNPWAPLPRMIGWDEVGDGSVYHAIKKQGKRPQGGVEGPRPGAHRVPEGHRVLDAEPHRLRGEVRRRRHRARLPRRPPARPRPSPGATPAGTCRSRSSPTTRR